MKSGKQVSRKAYKMTLGLFYLCSLILLDLLFLYLSNVFQGIELKGAEAAYIPLVPLWLTSVMTLLIWIFLRLAVPVEPLTDEERNGPLLQRLSFLQLFACSGTIIGVIWGISSFFINRIMADTIRITGWDAFCIYLFHFLTITIAAALLYTGTRIRRIIVKLFCFLFFIVIIAIHWLGIIAVLNVDYNTDPYHESCSDEGEYGETTDYENIPTGSLMEADTYEDIAWIDSAGISVINYCNEYVRNTPDDTTPDFIDQLLIDYLILQKERPDEDYVDDNYHRLDNKNWLNSKDCYRLYKLASMILEREPGERDEVYEILSEQILPVILEESSLYSASPLESLVNMLDYAYNDLQSPENEKLESLYAEMTSEKYKPIMAQLLPYFNRPYAMVHSNFNEVHLLWAYSFWARRWHDGHIGLCRQILDKILDTYPNTTYTKETMSETEKHYREKCLERKHTPEEILEELENAFADVPRPEKQTILIDEMEIEKQAKMGEALSRYTWQEIPQESLYENQDALLCFTPEGFRYYLPAFLMEAVRNYNPESHLYPLLIQSLTRVELSREFEWEHFEIFFTKEGKAVYHFLEWMVANHNDDFINMSDGSSQLWQAIESWWVQYEE